MPRISHRLIISWNNPTISPERFAMSITNWMSVGTVSLACFLGAACNSNDKDSTTVLRAGVPPKAAIVSEGNTQLTYTVEDRGRLYLYNASDDRVIGDYNVRPGQRFAV